MAQGVEWAFEIPIRRGVFRTPNGTSRFGPKHEPGWTMTMEPTIAASASPVPALTPVPRPWPDFAQGAAAP
jgi:hypothetical protein